MNTYYLPFVRPLFLLVMRAVADFLLPVTNRNSTTSKYQYVIDLHDFGGALGWGSLGIGVTGRTSRISITTTSRTSGISSSASFVTSISSIGSITSCIGSCRDPYNLSLPGSVTEFAVVSFTICCLQHLTIWLSYRSAYS